MDVADEHTKIIVAGRQSLRDRRGQDADARDSAADRRRELTDMRAALLDRREAAIQDVLSQAEERDRRAEERDRRAEQRDRIADDRSFATVEAERAAAARDRALSDVDRYAAGVDRDLSAGGRADLLALMRRRGAEEMEPMTIGEMAPSADQAPPAADPRTATPQLTIDGLARGPGSAARRDPVAMGVGAVMALHSVDEATATTALNQAATQHHVSVAAVALAILALASGTDEPVEDCAGRAATQLLGQAVTSWT